MILGIVITAGAAGWLLVLSQAQPANNPNNDQASNSSQATKSACDLFSQDIAASVLGATAQKSTGTNDDLVATDEINVSSCHYDNAATEPSNLVSASLMLRAARSEAHFGTNKLGFETTRGTDTDSTANQTIDNLGEAAFYNPGFGQVNVLVDGGRYWLIVQAGDKNLDLSQKLARQVLEKL